jgi:hypothetical protein
MVATPKICLPFCAARRHQQTRTPRTNAAKQALKAVSGSTGNLDGRSMGADGENGRRANSNYPAKH